MVGETTDRRSVPLVLNAARAHFTVSALREDDINERIHGVVVKKAAHVDQLIFKLIWNSLDFLLLQIYSEMKFRQSSNSLF